MPVTAGIVSVLLAALMAYAAARKLTHRQPVVEGYLRAGVPEEKLNSLAVVLLIGAAGLILGLFWAPIGVAAAAGAVLYFCTAIGFHLRADDAGNLPIPVILLALAAGSLALQLAL